MKIKYFTTVFAAALAIFILQALQALPPRFEQNSTPKALRAPLDSELPKKSAAPEIKPTGALPEPKLSPSDLHFHRLAVRSFTFSENIKLCELAPSEIAELSSMHPIFALSDKNEARPSEALKLKIENGKLKLDASREEFSIYVGGVNPCALYELNIDEFSAPKTGGGELGIELAQLGLRNKVQVFVKHSASGNGVFFRSFEDAKLVREEKISGEIPRAPFTLMVQLYGHSLSAFITKDGETKCLSQTFGKECFDGALDLRNIQICAQSTFNIFSSGGAAALVSGAKSRISSGTGQADLRPVSNEDLSPYFDGDGRIYFTFSARGIKESQFFQGVLSLDPSVFDVRMEGAIVFDHGDGLLRNAYASQLFFDRTQSEWRAYVCDFGDSLEPDKNSKTGFAIAKSKKSPLKGYSVMQTQPIGSPNGNFAQTTAPNALNYTDSSIQKIGANHYFLMGIKDSLRICSHPDFKELGELKLDLPPRWPKAVGPVWASIAPLPKGYPFRYILLAMAPFPPEIEYENLGRALYLYGANPKNISSDEYEF